MLKNFSDSDHYFKNKSFFQIHFEIDSVYTTNVASLISRCV